MKRHKSILNFSFQMLLIEKKWLNLKESLQMKDAEKSLNLKRKYVKVTTNHLLLLMKKVLTQYVWKHLPIKTSSL